MPKAKYTLAQLKAGMKRAHPLATKKKKGIHHEDQHHHKEFAMGTIAAQEEGHSNFKRGTKASQVRDKVAFEILGKKIPAHILAQYKKKKNKKDNEVKKAMDNFNTFLNNIQKSDKDGDDVGYKVKCPIKAVYNDDDRDAPIKDNAMEGLTEVYDPPRLQAMPMKIRKGDYTHMLYKAVVTGPYKGTMSAKAKNIKPSYNPARSAISSNMNMAPPAEKKESALSKFKARFGNVTSGAKNVANKVLNTGPNAQNLGWKKPEAQGAEGAPAYAKKVGNARQAFPNGKKSFMDRILRRSFDLMKADIKTSNPKDYTNEKNPVKKN